MENKRWEELVPTQDLEADSATEEASEPSTPESFDNGHDARAFTCRGQTEEPKKRPACAWCPAIVAILVFIGALGAFVAYRAITTTTDTARMKMERDIEHHSAPTPAPSISIKVLLWNVYWLNRDVKAIAEVLAANDADIIGMDEFIPYGPGKYNELVREINLRTTTRSFELQPNVEQKFMGYGTDIIFDSKVWKVLEGGKNRVVCPGTRDGGRAANWVVLQHRTSEKKLITGGIHLSYCPRNSCDWTNECEMGKLYDKLEEMKSKHDGPVLWMGDLNHCIWDRVIDNALDGHIGKRSVFTMEDLVKAKEEKKPTIVDGGCAIDHILAESDFERLDGGRTGQENNGQKIGGSDHYPVFASVRFPRRSIPEESEANHTSLAH